MICRYGYNGTVEEIQELCGADSQCQGFYECTNDNDEDTCPDDADATHMLITGVVAESLMAYRQNSTVYAKASGRTAGGTADGAWCTFPFEYAGYEYYECAATNSDRPWCYTTKPGLWGYCDAYSQDILGAQWSITNWSDCPVECGGALSVRDATCVNSTTGEALEDVYCGAKPALSYTCNDHSCTDGCNLELADRLPCGGFYEDIRSQYISASTRQDVCESYGCCWIDEEDTKGAQCYFAEDTVLPSDAAEGDRCVEQGPAGSTTTTATAVVTQCGLQCCRGDTELGECAYTMGYAEPGREDGACAAYGAAVEDTDFLGWYNFGPHARSSCTYLGSGTGGGTSSGCKAYCSEHPSCNTINWHEEASLCERLNCGMHRNPPNLDDYLGWDTWVWSAGTSYRWAVTSDWSVCVDTNGVVDYETGRRHLKSVDNPDTGLAAELTSLASDALIRADNTSSVNLEITTQHRQLDEFMNADELTQFDTTCPLTQTRDVECLYSDGTSETTDEDSSCFTYAIKPESARTCWGACGMNRSCEELGWERVATGYNTYGTTGVCGSGNLGGDSTTGGKTNAGFGTEFTGCWDEMTLAEASQKCTDVGARLCSYEEARLSVTVNEMCLFDSGPWFTTNEALIWSSTPCVLEEDAAPTLAPGEFLVLCQGVHFRLNCYFVVL